MPRIPIPVEDLVAESVDDGSDYHDGLDAYLSHTFEADSGVLTLTFKRASDQPNDPNLGPDHGDAEYRFRLLPGTPSSVQDGGEQAVRTVAKAIVEARGRFADALACGLQTMVSHDRILEICAEEGLDFAEVRALLEIGDVA